MIEVYRASGRHATRSSARVENEAQNGIIFLLNKENWINKSILIQKKLL
jgi:hypothetical protein